VFLAFVGGSAAELALGRRSCNGRVALATGIKRFSGRCAVRAPESPMGGEDEMHKNCLFMAH
jgi:hypothetical protein